MMSVVMSHHPKYRTKLCRKFASGDCHFGNKCSFLHPAPRIIPPSLLAQSVFNWNVLLPQLLALANQQAILKKMPPISPPRFQGPQLIDEDPSPSTSLLLSTSDGSSSEQMPQTRRFSRQNKYLCRHFLRTGGWCPVGTKCRFNHDVATLPSAGAQKTEHLSPSETDVYGGQGRTISGGVLMGMQVPSPPIISQEYWEPPRYTEAELAQPHQPMYWPNYTWQAYRPYYATVPAMTTVPVPATAAPSLPVQHSAYPPSQTNAQTVPPSETQNSLPQGTYEVNGTTYFPPSVPSVPGPTPVTYSIPVHPAPYSHPMAEAYPYYAPPALPASYYDISNQTRDIRPQTSFDPFGSDPMMLSELPVIPRLGDYQMSPIQYDVVPFPLSSPSALSGDLVPTTTTHKPAVTRDHEFPYRPPKNQRAGHARRISVNIKKHDRANSG